MFYLASRAAICTSDAAIDGLAKSRLLAALAHEEVQFVSRLARLKPPCWLPSVLQAASNIWLSSRLTGLACISASEDRAVFPRSRISTQDTFAPEQN